MGSTAYDKTSAIQGARNIVDEPLFLRLLELCPLPDVAIELTLTNVRRGLLESVSDGLSANDLSKVMSAIGTQCFINEYVYSQSGHESQLVSKLQNQIERLLKKNQQPPSDALLCLSSYVTINELKWVGNLKSNKANASIIDIQVAKLKVEKDIKDNLITLFDNESRISKTVRQQYEKYPYPRWVQLGASITPVTVKDSVRNINLKVRTNKILETLNPQVLIAGCGTGQHSIGTAKRLRNSKVTAIDLSKASIAYAKRKSDELKVPNIDYIHCDILQVHKLRKSFDIIETVGVLHHMEDPIEGWKALIRCLRPGGLMKIGLYSDLARQHIVEIRNEIDINHSIEAIDKIRELRALILGSDKPQHKKIVSSPDFYSLSEVVDLILHVQEHRFNIPQINDILVKLNLEFCGFEDFEINRRFKMQHPNTSDLLDLHKWHKFEVAYPDTFARMYQFWCQKID